jgi:hypothetical protein
MISKEIVESTEKPEPNQTSNRYSHLIIEWIREWPEEIKIKILVDSLILKDASSESLNSEFDFIDDQTIWSVLIEQNNVDMIMKWIEFSFAPKTSIDQETSSEKVSPYLFKSKLSQEMIDLIYDSKFLPYESKCVLLNFLAKFNVYCTQESGVSTGANPTMFNKMIKRLSSSNTLFDKKSFQAKDDQFHLNLILNLIHSRHIPVDFLWSYLNFYK